MSHKIALSVASSWNSAANSLKSLCKGNDWMLFFKVVIFLLNLSFLEAISVHRLFLIVLPIAFVGFFVYEKKEDEVDGLILEILSLGCKLKSNIVTKDFQL